MIHSHKNCLHLFTISLLSLFQNKIMVIDIKYIFFFLYIYNSKKVYNIKNWAYPEILYEFRANATVQ